MCTSFFSLLAPLSLCLALLHWLPLSPCLSSSLLPSLSLSQSIASCLFSSLRDTQRSSGRSGSWLRQGEAIKTTADWNRLREQQCKLKGAHVVEQGVNSNRLACWNKEAHTSHSHGEREPYASAADCVSVREAFTESLSSDGFRWLLLCSLWFHLFGESLIMAELSRWANEGDSTLKRSLSIWLNKRHQHQGYR